ncbi:ABC transporter permease [Rhizobium halophytocola]|uniref:Peptide/nickel transport system permease protein n=1 Tax=Rhizobium halophytocola TaxID=735519 RepID=A0ABS4E100_9HYPH|nr:ABC transporter permease [Rhizobium halophytocola]MBP1851618.1 peptide/nickel transport system permease protein [Rhizobium halophytocola]
MLALLLKRFGSLVLTLLAVSAVIFAVMSVLPGDPAAIMLGTSASADTLEALRRELGLDQPMILRYFSWLGGVLTGDLGNSYTYGVPVAGLMADRLMVTIPLALMAIVISIAIAIPLGVLSAARRNSLFDHVAGFFSQLFIAVPAFWVALILILVFSISLGWFPSGGFSGWSAGFFKGLGALLLPAIALGLPQAGVLTRVARSSVLEVLNEDFVRTARAKGLTRSAALWRHAVRNALVPVATILGLQFTFLVAGAVLIENVFSLPGLGQLAYKALTQRDIIVMQDVVLFFAGLVIIVNFLVDLSYLLLDPRLRSGSR